MNVMICDGKVIREKTFNELYGVTKEQLKKFIEIGKKNGFFEYKIANDTFKIHVLRKKKQKKVRGDEIIFPSMSEGKRKFFVTNIMNAKSIPRNNTYRTFITVYGETMSREEFFIRVGLWSTFFSNNKLTKAISFKLNGIDIKVERRIKNMIKYSVTNTLTNKTTPGLIKRGVMDLTGCSECKVSQSDMFNPIAYYKNYIIRRVGV